MTTNGHTTQEDYLEALRKFATQKTIADGLGPVYNALSCADCHQNPVVGGNSQVFSLRAGHLSGGLFVEHRGGSLIQDRAIDPAIQEQVLGGNEIRALRGSPSLLGLGLVEAIDDQTLRNIAALQPSASGGLIHGEALEVLIQEDSSARSRVGRFGVKLQQASLLSFAGEAYTDHVGITTPISPREHTSNGNSIEFYDRVPVGHPSDPDQPDMGDLDAFVLFMRATKAPPRDAWLASTPAAQAGSMLFNQIGCSICHVRTIQTAPVGTFLNDNRFGTTPETQVNAVSPALGDKIIHPFSDFLLHDVGTGDGIQQGPPSTRNKVRTIPLWGLRARGRFMHDGSSLTLEEAILRHGGEAAQVGANYRKLSAAQRGHLLAFLRSL